VTERVKTQADVVTFSLSFHCDICLSVHGKDERISLSIFLWTTRLADFDFRGLAEPLHHASNFHYPCPPIFFSSVLLSPYYFILFFFFFLTEETCSSALSRFRCHVLCIDYAAVVKQLC
jgi:hypothetical protein